ncbi:phage portal protein [Arthrobacter sp. SDTb3-6]|uniref:phage portal protein n=1 Tax=Arthrobacter sp. SDTb3-6 TaxID=2713571 RepID=UPI00210E3241|nr:phage portal protein [Arthrobacter sp. SDTb3-6]
MGPVIKSAGELVTIGSFAGGYPTQTTKGSRITVADAGVPLANYSPAATDPLTLWKTQPALRKVVGYAARQVASIPWHAYHRVSDTDRQRDAGGRAERLLNAPARFITGFKLWRDVAIDAMIYDLFCVLYLEGTSGKPATLVRIPPRLLTVKSDFLGQVTQIILETPAGTPDVDLTDAPIAVGWGWHPSTAGGVSPMLTLSQILEETRRSVEWRNAQWHNSPKIGGLLKRPVEAKKWDEKNRDRFLQSWRTWRDTPRAGGTPILEDGMQYEKLDGLNPKEAKDIEGRQLTDAEVASAFYIPPELVGARPGNFSNISAFRQMLFGPILGPLFTELQQSVNQGLLGSLDSAAGSYVEMDRDAAINGSFLEQARLLSTLVGGPVMTRAEGRAKLNLPHIDGSDELIVPLNVTAGGQASPQDTGSQNISDTTTA